MRSITVERQRIETAQLRESLRRAREKFEAAEVELREVRETLNQIDARLRLLPATAPEKRQDTRPELCGCRDGYECHWHWSQRVKAERGWAV